MNDRWQRAKKCLTWRNVGNVAANNKIQMCSRLYLIRMVTIKKIEREVTSFALLGGMQVQIPLFIWNPSVGLVAERAMPFCIPCAHGEPHR